MGADILAADFLCRTYFYLCNPKHQKCAGIHHLLYVGVFSYDMVSGDSEADQKDKIRYNKQQNYEEGICVKNHGTVSE